MLYKILIIVSHIVNNNKNFKLVIGALIAKFCYNSNIIKKYILKKLGYNNIF